ncbi:MAG: YkgJ family cysteine cluster protein [Deltaproteobacteria bacterium]|nr:YkgJ family cysteine cluster protein [Deltaproteobacteria bacterium]
MSELAYIAIAAIALLILVTKGKILSVIWTAAISVFAELDLAATRFIQMLRPPRFVILGSCFRCGECCRMIMAHPPRLILNRPTLLRLFSWFHYALHGLIEVARGPNGEIIFSCLHQRPDNRCGIYKRRPLFCRKYPKKPFFEQPQVLPSCSYQVAPLVVARMKKRLSLPILNPGVTVHHPTRLQRDAAGQNEDFEWLDDTF